jgi:hypothetical protein
LAERPVIEVDTKDRKLDHYFGRHLRLAGFLRAGSGLEGGKAGQARTVCTLLYHCRHLSICLVFETILLGLLTISRAINAFQMFYSLGGDSLGCK